MIIRPAYPDEISRAGLFLEGHPVPSGAGYVLGLKEHPVERIAVAVPWWEATCGEGSAPEKTLRFFLGCPNGLDPDVLKEILAALVTAGRERAVTYLHTDFSLPAAHPLFRQLTETGFTIDRTDRCFHVPGKEVKERTFRIFGRLGARVPADWKAASIRGHDPEAVFKIVGSHGLMPPQQFSKYWDGASKERFEEAHSRVLMRGDEILGVILVTRRGESELHVHVEAVNTEYAALSSLISTTLRNDLFRNCAEGFPEVFTFRADSSMHLQTGNSALRHGGTEDEPMHFLKRRILPATSP